MTAYQLTVVYPEDLTQITAVCPQEGCGARLTLTRQGKDVRLPKVCAGCGIELDVAAHSVISAFNKLHGAFEHTKIKFEFPLSRTG